jgi:predicted AAA+ superfamily ATPase
MKRIYESLFDAHLAEERQMLFFSGPRQVGKTTLGQALAGEASPHLSLNWDNADHRRLILAGPGAVAHELGLDTLARDKARILFDEIHKFGKWKGFLKGFYDTYSDRARILVTGSSKLGVYKRGGDSLMGRYFHYRVHPLTLAEVARGGVWKPSGGEISRPERAATRDVLGALLRFGGFPEPFLKRSESFSTRWKRLRKEQLFREDIRDGSRIQEIAQMELLADLLRARAGQLINYSDLSNKVGVSVDTIRRWCSTLESFYYCYFIRPWSKNVTRSLIKEPKVYLYDWSLVEDPGARFENLVASHLLKAVELWTDTGRGEYALHFLRDKEKREVDFAVVRNGKPWFLVEAKSSDRSPSVALGAFHRQLKPAHSFQVVQALDFIDRDCFEVPGPIAVPALTLLSQLA